MAPSQWGVILGGAQSVWTDLLAVETMLAARWPGIVLAVNDVGVHWPRPLDHWVTMHPTKMAKWMRQRAANGAPGEFETWGSTTRICQHLVRHWQPSGSSGLLAVQVAREFLHLERVVLCGVPMTPTTYFPESDEEHRITADRRWSAADKHWKGWEQAYQESKISPLWLRSMGGRTQQWLGAPTLEWLQGGA